ncbi:MAG: phosphotransferase [Alphaproteobacteria bacterium]|jgi:thiamine kinase-like enzyme|nr:phosphotransferase [Alphaproteobacteria bacterium]
MLDQPYWSAATPPDPDPQAALPAALEEALARIPLFAGRPDDAIAVEPLGGDTNRVYRIRAEEGSYVLRVPAADNPTLVDRVHEKRNARIAASVGVAAQLLFFDESDGLMLTLYITRSVRMSPALFQDPAAVARATAVLQRLHGSRREFLTRLDPFVKIATYRSLAAHRGIRLPDALTNALGSLEMVRDALWAASVPPVACHGQPLPEHFLDTGEQMYVVDWEQAGMGDPMWDLACLSLESGFDPECEEAMLRAYFGAAVPETARARTVLYKAAGDILWAVWGFLRPAGETVDAALDAAGDGLAHDPHGTAMARVERCRALMASPAFAEALETVRHGERAGG